MSVKKGDLIIIEDCEVDLQKSIDDFYYCWQLCPSMANSTITLSLRERSVVSLKRTTTPVIMDNRKINYKIKLKYYGTEWVNFTNNRINAIVTEIIFDNHLELDLIKMIETDGTVRFFRRTFIERFVANK